MDDFDKKILTEHCAGKSAEEVLSIVLKHYHKCGYNHNDIWQTSEMLYNPSVMRRMVVTAMEFYKNNSIGNEEERKSN